MPPACNWWRIAWRPTTSPCREKPCVSNWTANGKLDKRALPKPGLVKQHYTAPVGEIEEKLAAVWADVLKLERVGSSDNFFELGGDSILSLQIIARAKRQGIKLSPKQLFEKQTIAQLATVARLIEKKVAVEAPQQISGEQLLLPIHARFFDMDIPQRHHWNQSVMLKPLQAVDATHLEAALASLLAHHDALRLSFVEQQGQWQARYQSNSASVLWSRELDDIAGLGALADEAQRSLDLKDGPLLRALLVHLPEGEQRLLLVIHHLVVDGVSWRVLLEDLQSAYTAIAAGRAVQLPAKSSAFKLWGERLQAHARSEALAAERDYWLGSLDGATAQLPHDHLEHPLPGVGHATSRLNKALTRQLLSVAPAAYRTQINDLLLAALSRVLCDWSRQPSVLIQLEGHGREELFDDLDLSRTVGWFSSLFPVRLTPGADLGGSIRAIKEQLRAVPNKGIGYGILRYLADAEVAHPLLALPEARVTFNYLGQFDGSFDRAEVVEGALFVPSGESSGANQAEERPANGLSLNGQVFDGELELDWGFSRALYLPATIEALAYEQELSRLVEHCSQGGQLGVTPSDFPLATLTAAQLERLPVVMADIEDIYPLSPMQQGILFHAVDEPDGAAYTNQLRADVRQLDLARDDLAAGFALDQAPLLRLTLVRTTTSDYHLIHTSHHILMDGWSTSQLFGEVLQRYAGAAVPQGAGRYRDYIEWLGQRDAQASRAFWAAALADLQEPTRLANAVGKRQSLAVGHGEHEHAFGAALTADLNRFAREHKVTLNTLVQAAWLVLLQRYTGQDCVAFGADRPVHQHPAGGGCTFATVAGGGLVAAGAGPQPGVARARTHAAVRYPALGRAGGGRAVRQPAGVRELPDGRSARPGGRQCPGILGHKPAGADQLPADAGALGNLELLAGEPRQAALDWGKGTVTPLDSGDVLTRIDAQVRAQPQAPAILFAEHEVDYASLDRSANRLAHKLRELGVGPEVRVGVCLSRTPRMIVSLLAILKAHLRLHRQAQGRGDQSRQPGGADPLVPGGLWYRAAARGAGLDVDLLRPVGVGNLRHPRRGRLSGTGGQRPGPGRTAAARAGQADQHRAVGDCRPAAGRADPGVGEHHQPGR